jgi:hypothetical protein
VEVYSRRDRDGVVNAVGELSARILTSVGNKSYYTQLRLDPLSKKGGRRDADGAVGHGNDLIFLKREQSLGAGNPLSVSRRSRVTASSPANAMMMASSLSHSGLLK